MMFGTMRIAPCSNVLGAEPTVQLVQRPMPAVLASGR